MRPYIETQNTIKTKTVTRGIYDRIPVGNGQFRHDKIGEQRNTYVFEVADDDILRINDKNYKVDSCSEFTIKIIKTKVKAAGGAVGLMYFFLNESLDNWEQKVIENCKPIKQ